MVSHPASSIAQPSNQEWRDSEQSSRYPPIGQPRQHWASLRPLIGQSAGRMVVWCDVSGKVRVSFLLHTEAEPEVDTAKIAHVWQDTSLCGAWLCLWNIIAVLVLHLEMASCYHGNVNCAYWLNVTKQNTPQKYIFYYFMCSLSLCSKPYKSQKRKGQRADTWITHWRH